MLRVSSIFVCPKYLATIITFAPLFIKSDAQLCLKSCNLICFTPAFSAILIFSNLKVSGFIGSTPPNTKNLLLNLGYFYE